MLPLPSISILAWMLSNRLDRLGDNAVEQALYASYAPWINGAGTLWLIGCASGLLLAWAQKTRTVRLVFAATGLAAALVLLNGHQSLAPVKSSRLLAEGIRPHLSTETRLYMAGFYDQTLPFYLQRTFTLVDYRDELGFGADQEPGKAITGSQAFLSEWNNTPRAMAVIHPDYHTRKLPQLPPGRILVNDYQRIVIIKP